jgi:hypothetical protein
MMDLMKWQILSLLLVFAVTFNACGANSESKKQTQSSQSNTEIAQTTSQKNKTKLQTDLNVAKKAGKAVFVVVTGTAAVNVDKATTIAKSASTIYKNSVVLEINKDDVTNAQLVAEWRLAGAPIPLILVISPKGYPVSGLLLEQANPKALADLVPTPKMDDVYAALNNKKAVFLVISKKSNLDKTKILENCKTATAQLKNKAVIVEIDLTDSKEAAFIKQLNLKNAPNTSSVLVLNATGQTTGSFEGKAEVSELVNAATKVVSSGCGTGCAPGGC